jgi:hypothetical protein
MEHASEESDQLPEEGPSEQVEEDTGEGERDEAKESPGARHSTDPGQATGNPKNAG